MVLRPSHPGDVSLGRDGAFLIGEAAGFISTSSFEGISFAMDSARLLAEVLTAHRRISIRPIGGPPAICGGRSLQSS